MNIALPSFVQSALSLLIQAGFEAYVVGGCVRDSLMGQEPADWDITTSALPTEIIDVFSEYPTINTGLQHGTITVIVEDAPLEITTYRVDGQYVDGRHPAFVTFTSLLTEDLKRRDFTINAMAYHPDAGLIDPFNGQADIQARTIRCVGEPMERFSEDALRILRALRFSAVLGFAIDEKTAMAIHRLADTLCCVSIERITAECKRLICGKNVDEILRNYGDVFTVFLPEIADSFGTLSLSKVPAVPYARLATLFYHSNAGTDTVESALRRLRLDTQTIGNVKCLLSVPKMQEFAGDAYLLRLLHHLGPKLIFDYFAILDTDERLIERTRQLLVENVCYRIAMLAVTGDDLLSVGISPGPDIGNTLLDLLYAVIDNKCLNEKEALLQYAITKRAPVQ